MIWIALLFGLFIIGIIILANLGMLGLLGFMTRIPYGDKAGHFILYGILTLLIDLALFHSLPRLKRNRLVTRVALILGLLIGLEEVSQQYLPSRSFDLVDLAFSYLGVIFFSCMAVIRGRS